MYGDPRGSWGSFILGLESVCGLSISRFLNRTCPLRVTEVATSVPLMSH